MKPQTVINAYRRGYMSRSARKHERYNSLTNDLSEGIYSAKKHTPEAMAETIGYLCKQIGIESNERASLRDELFIERAKRVIAGGSYSNVFKGFGEER